MLNKIRSLFGMQQPRAPSNAVSPTGRFSISDGRCYGVVTAAGHFDSRQLTITLESVAEPLELARMTADVTGDSGLCEFAFNLPTGLPLNAVLAGSVGLFADNGYAPKSQLELERSCEIALMQGQPDPARTVLYDLTFMRESSCEPCFGSGWGNPEELACCTEGSHATLDIPAVSSPDLRYELSIDCFAFFAPPPHPTTQRMTVTLNGFQQTADIGLDSTSPIRFFYPIRSLLASETVHIEFDLPNCFRPIDLKLNEDVRQLSFGFRRLTFSKLSF